MSSCTNCKKKKTLKQMCCYCKYSFCFKCLQPEIHKCEELNNMKRKKLEALVDNLNSQKCVAKKIQNI